MDGDRTTRALARIEGALARLEAAARTSFVAESGDAELAARHSKLRDAVTQTLRQLDELIEGGAT